MTILSLWLPILLSAVLVWVASALIWTVLPWHKSDFRKLPDEEAARAAINGAEPGKYMLPYCVDQNEYKKEEVQQKFIDGPQAYLTVIPNGLPNMAPKLLQIFLFYILIGVLAAYFVSRTIEMDSSYLEVFRIAGTTAFIAHGVAFFQDSIWFGRPWSLTAKTLFDALIYGLLTGGVFGWLV